MAAQPREAPREVAAQDGRRERAAYAPLPIPCGEDAPTVAAYRTKNFYPFARAQFGLPQNPEENPPADAGQPVADLVEAQLPFMFLGTLCERQAAWKKATQLAKDGHEHPVLDWMRAMEAALVTKDPDTASDLLRGLEAKAEGLPNRAFLHMLAAYGRQRTRDTRETGEAFCAAAAAWLKEVLQDPQNARPAKHMLGNFVNYEHNEMFQAVLPQIEPVNRWFYLLIHGQFAYRQAWRARGGGWASTVTEEGWDKFHKGLQTARADLEEAWRLRPDLPEPAQLLVSVSGGDGRDDTRKWFDRTVAAEFDHYGAYDSYLWYARPRWGGSPRKMRAFAEECLATKRLDTLIPYVYVRASLTASAEEFGRWQDVVHEEGFYEKSREVLAATLRHEGLSQRQKDLYGGLLAMIAWEAGDLKTAVEANKACKDRVGSDLRALVGYLSAYSITRMLDVLAQNPPGELFDLAQRCANREMDGAQDLLAAARRKDLFSVPNAFNLVTPLAFIVSLDADCKNGHWTVLQGTSWMDCWGWINQGYFEYDNEVYSTEEKTCMLSLRVRVPENLEIETKVEFLEGGGNAMFKVCLDDPSFPQSIWRAPAVQISRKGGRVTAGVTEATKETWPVEWRTDGEPAVVSVVSRDNLVSLTVDGKPVFTGVDASGAFRPSSHDKTRALQIQGKWCRFAETRVRGPKKDDELNEWW
ncbi:MAG: hypothetical protein FWF96_00980 [Kiritimatiellaeota bacterium]|nr:hypothetical protein [Kiritimatiellota bacterium]